MGGMKSLVGLVAVALCACVGCSGGCHDGEWRCHNGVAQYCGTYDWENSQNCAAIGETCAEGPAACSGFDMACCQFRVTP